MSEMKLNEAQKLAAFAKDRNMIVTAGAGTGKTSVLVNRFLYFLTQENVPVSNILALTFTDKAANEMKTRIRDELLARGRERDRRELESSYISTIHGFCARVLREHPLEAGVDPDFRVMEGEEAEALKEQAFDEIFEAEALPDSDLFLLLSIYKEESLRKGVLKLFEAARREGLDMETYLEGKHPQNSEKVIPELAKAILTGFEELGEEEYASAFQLFSKKAVWGWDDVEGFKGWRKKFSNKGGKETREIWQEIRKNCDALRSAHLDQLMAPYWEKMKKLTGRFEEVYGSLKQKRGFLDFDDLEHFTVRLFSRPERPFALLRERYQKKFTQILVDEFQDTNPLQLELIRKIAGDRNLFFVGDYKQSIYGFRGAEPQLFLEMVDQYTVAETAASIPLAINYRSDPEVLGFVNQFFEYLWQKAPTAYQKIEPDKENSQDASVEVLTVRPADGEKMEGARLREAEAVAERILELKQEGMEFGRMAILFQATTAVRVYEQALKKRGIPYYMVAGGGFYHQQEVKDMISFLAFLENPHADIPLAATLRSPFFQVKDDTLFYLSRAAKGGDEEAPLYLGLKIFEKLEEILEEEKKKLRLFSQVTQDLLKVKDRLKMTELLDLILEKTGFELSLLADAQGVRRYANLKKLINVARELERYERLKLGSFLRTLQRLETREVKESEAAVEAQESGDVVRISTIHRSKGLEYEVVFVADMGYEKQGDKVTWLQTSREKGFSIKIRNELTQELEAPLSWQEMDQAVRQRRNEEWRRLFYVAATRAKKRLIMSGVYQPSQKAIQGQAEWKTWLEWVLSAPSSVLEGVDIREAKKKTQKRMRAALAQKKGFKEIFGEFRSVEPESLIKSKKMRTAFAQEADRVFESARDLEITPSRAIDLPVSAYAAFSKSEQDYFHTYELGYKTADGEPDEAAFPEADEVSAADFGTAIHGVLEHLDFDDPEPTLNQRVSETLAGYSDAKKKEALDILRAFLKSERFQWIRKAKKIYREIPFILNERHGRLHGVIDLLIQDASGDWHVLDYKTAEGDAQKVKTSGYLMQIQIYALAVQELLGVTPKSGVIYFLKNQYDDVQAFQKKSLEDFSSQLRSTQELILKVSHTPFHD